MKNLTKIVIILVMMTITAFAFASGNRENKHIGNGMVTSMEHLFPVIERVHAGSGADVRIHFLSDVQETRVVVNADSNLHEFIDVRHDRRHQAVEIRAPRQSDSFPRFSVDVYCSPITGVGLAGTANITIVEPFDIESFTFDMAGSGTMTLRGSAENVTINLVGDGTFNGQEFKTSNVNAHAVGGGSLIVWTDNLAINMVGNTTISYRGNPAIDITGVGNGRFVRIGD